MMKSNLVPSLAFALLIPLCADLGAQTFTAGHEVFTAVDPERNGRELLTDVWYPVGDKDVIGQPPLQYYQHYNDGDEFWWYDSPFEGGVQGAVASEHGPFPLVVLSHGGGGSTVGFSYLGESLASAGYVTVAPRHTGHSWGTPLDEDRTRRLTNKAADLTFITDTIIDRSNRSGDVLFEAVDRNRIAHGGHSAGVPTSAALLLGKVDHDVAVPTDDRSRALFLLEGRLWWTGEEQTVDVPTFFIGGTVNDDFFNTVSLESFNIAAPRLHTIQVENAGHLSVGMNLCQYADALEAAEAPEAVYKFIEPLLPPEADSDALWHCSDEQLTHLKATQDLVAEQAVAFFDAYLKNDEQVAAGSLPQTPQLLTFEVTPSRGNPDVLLTDPVGRRLGLDDQGNEVNDFDNGGSSLAGRGRRKVFTIAQADLVEGDYVLSASDVSRSDTTLHVTTELHGLTDIHSATATLTDEFSPHGGLTWALTVPAGVSVADCDANGSLDAADFDCVSTITARDLLLSALSTVPGDLNGDGNVDFADFTALAHHFGHPTASYSEGNINLEGGTEFEDFLILVDNFGSNRRANVATVPEPSGHIGLFGLFLVILQRSRGRSSLLQSYWPTTSSRSIHD